MDGQQRLNAVLEFYEGDVFSIYVSNLTPDHLNKAIGRLGVSLNWDELGSEPGLQELFGGTGARETATTFKII